MARAKGTALIGAVKMLRKRKDEARALLPEALHRYLSVSVLPASWYPEEDLLKLIRALLEIMPGDREENLRLMGSATARALGKGVYSKLLGNKNDSATSSSVLWSSMHDTGKLRSSRNDETGEIVFELENHAYPSFELCAITGSFIQEALRMSGRRITLEKSGCVLDGAPHCTWKGR